MTTTFTRNLSKAAFTHIMEFVLNNTNVKNALVESGIDDTYGLLTLTDAIVENLVYPDTDPQVKTMHKLKKGEMGLIKCFIHYVYYRGEINDPIGNDWSKITMEDFDFFRANLSYTSRFGSLSTLTFKTPTPPASSSSSTLFHGQSPVDIFKRGIKRDPSVFPRSKGRNC
jgi:hypothetical protein